MRVNRETKKYEHRSATAILVAIAGCSLVAGCGGSTSEEDATVGDAHRAPTLPAVSGFPGSAGAFAGFNLLLVTLDTIRADHLACYGAEGARTPALDRLAGEGILFSQVAAAAPTTLPAHCSILTGLYPVHHGARVNGVFRLADSVHTAAERLKNDGYRTAAFVSAFVLDAQFGLAQGFDRYDDDLAGAATPLQNQFEERPGGATTERAIDWIRTAAKQRFFCWVHYFDAHTPYEPPGKYAAQFPESPYDGEIAFVDECLGRLVALLDELDIDERTLVVVVGDHGEGLGEHDELVHGYLTYESTLRVPLVMRCGVQLGGGVRIDRRVSQVDILPTTLSLLGVDTTGEMDGIDLTGASPDGRAIYAETLHGMVEFGWAPLAVVYAGPLKYIEGPDPELFDLTADPRERRNLLASRSDTALAMRARLAALFGPDIAVAEGANPNFDPGAAGEDMLARLGYTANVGEIPEAASRPDPKSVIRYAQEAFGHVAAADEASQPLETRIRRLKKAAATYPDFVLAWKRLGHAYRQAGDYERAAKALGHSVELRPDSANALFDLAMLLTVYQNETEKAAALLGRVVSSYPGHVAAQYMLGVIHRDAGRDVQAAECFRAAFEQDPTYRRSAEFMVMCFLKSGRGGELPALFLAELEANPGAGAARTAYARFLSTVGRDREAEKVLREGLEERPDDGVVVSTLALLLVQSSDASVRDVEEGLELMERHCAKAGNQDPRAWLTLAVACQAAGDARALEAARRAETMAKGQRDLETLESAKRLIAQLHGR